MYWYVGYTCGRIFILSHTSALLYLMYIGRANGYESYNAIIIIIIVGVTSTASLLSLLQILFPVASLSWLLFPWFSSVVPHECQGSTSSVRWSAAWPLHPPFLSTLLPITFLTIWGEMTSLDDRALLNSPRTFQWSGYRVVCLRGAGLESQSPCGNRNSDFSRFSPVYPGDYICRLRKNRLPHPESFVLTIGEYAASVV
jgi:hypothetical protein